MGWLSTLGNIFGNSKGGGYGDYIKVGGEVLGSIAANRAQGRATEGVANQAQDRNALLSYIAEQNAREARAKLLEDATKDRADRTLTNAETRAKQVREGDLLANVQPVTVSGMPDYIPKIQFNGGLTPAAFGPATRQAGRNLAQQALAAQMSGSDIPGLPDVSQLGGNAPQPTPLPQSGTLDTILNTASAVGLGAKGISEAQTERDKARAEAEAKNAPIINRSNAGMIPPAGAPTLPGAPGPEAAMASSGNRGTSILAAMLDLKRRQDEANQRAMVLNGGTDSGGTF